ncbi:LLM class flavin-dependent oxidoreductase [Mangrovimonas cancribranchiae]|uniref:Luciferase-like monooxygenase n=1 Tax=Mangrovimonas cancribranchiae TaxID=3080055 RepID=A0AAU6P0F0_9FLAO
MKKKISYSILELATVSENTSIQETFAKSLNLAQHAEKLGYNRFWLAEHHNMKSIASAATTVLMGYIAGGTKTIRVGSGGIMLPNHSPLIVAEQFGTLGNLYPNRIDLGLGRAPGTDQETAHEIRSDRMKAVYQFPDEVVKIQQYFSSENNNKVRSYLSEGVNVPIYILGSSTDSAYVAAEKGLPYVFASHFAPAQLQQALAIYHQNFKPSKYLDKPYTIAGIGVIAADRNDEANQLATSMYKMILGVLTGNIDYIKPPVPITSELQGIINHPKVQQMTQCSFIGDKATIKQDVIKFIEDTQVDELIAVSHIYGEPERLKSFEIFAEIMNEI